MYPFGGIIIAVLVAGYATSVICRFVLRRAKQPSWFIVLLTTGLSVIASLAATFQGDLLRPSHWSSKVDAPVMLMITGVPSALVAFVAALKIVAIYRDHYGSTNPVR